jgi:peptide-methionine (S)-S-oxide reductase
VPLSSIGTPIRDAEEAADASCFFSATYGKEATGAGRFGNRSVMRISMIHPRSAFRLTLAVLLGLAVSLPSVAAPRNEATPPAPAGLAKATFAGGCFWCMEHPFDAIDGVASVESGYTGGDRPYPTYEEVSSGGTGHAEAVEIVYDPKKVSYEKLLHVYWRNIDPLVANRQFCDAGEQYRSAIFVHDAAQRKEAEASKAALMASARFKNAPILTEIVDASTFYRAEEYHQDYYKKNPIRYNFYRNGCGRDARLQKIWGDEAGGE